jgi:hypothetical protein
MFHLEGNTGVQTLNGGRYALDAQELKWLRSQKQHTEIAESGEFLAKLIVRARPLDSQGMLLQGLKDVLEGQRETNKLLAELLRSLVAQLPAKTA